MQHTMCTEEQKQRSYEFDASTFQTDFTPKSLVFVLRAIPTRQSNAT